MIDKRVIGSAAAVAALAAAVVLYTVHPVKSSDHQDTYNLALQVGHNASADITDVYVFPAPDNANNVVFAMDVWPLIPTGLGGTKVFDPSLIWQFKISHGAASNPVDEVIQISATGSDTANQRLTLYGPGKPNEAGGVNTLISPSVGTILYNTTGKLNNNKIQFYAGPRADPFFFDLLAFYSFLGDRNFGTHSSQSDPGAGNTLPNVNGNNYPPVKGLAPAYDKAAGRTSAPSFNGSAAGTTAGYSPFGNYACSTSPPGNTLASFNVLSLVVEVPKSLLENGYSSHSIHVWATTNSSKTSS